MLRRPTVNLNQQSQQATVLLIREVLAMGIELTEVPFYHPQSISALTRYQVYVDALGTTTTYQAYLSSQFPGINFTVETKADSKYKIVGAASVAAKVTRDACVDGWVFEETGYMNPSSELGSGYPSGRLACDEIESTKLMPCLDPKTQAWLKASIEPTFGFPKLVRFSWTTVKVLLEKAGHRVQWFVLCLSLLSCRVSSYLFPR